MSKRVVIVGGGIIGLASAWYCQRRGHHVTIIDRQPAERDGCSFGNAGMIVPSHFTPLAAPGMVRLGLKWMWNPESPFYIRPRLSWDLLRWLWQFRQSCTAAHVHRAAPLLRDLHLQSRACFEELQSQFDDEFGLVTAGLLMLCRTEAMLQEETETAQRAEQLGIEARVMSPEELASTEPNMQMDVRGGVYYPSDCHLSPQRLMSAIERQVQQQGCHFHWGTRVDGFRISGDRVTAIKTSQGDLTGDEVLICGGVWSAEMARHLRISLPMQAGKGYSLTLKHPRQQPRICSILTEARVAVTPMGDSLRFGGTMEIAGLDASITQSRIRGLVRSIPDYFPQIREEDFEGCQPWVGLRPCSPDGLPYLGRPARWKNVIVSTGHAMMGISLAMISGRIAAETVDGAPPSIPNLQLLSPDRYTANR